MSNGESWQIPPVPPRDPEPLIKCRFGAHGRGKRFGDDAEWRRDSGQVLKGQPVCVDCWENPKFWKLCRWCGKRHFAPPRTGWTGWCDVVCWWKWNDRRLARAEEKRKAKRRVKHTKRRCEECGTPFLPARADARFHSAACKQRAYRRRLAASGTPRAPSARSH
jgi:hypothetical protein